MLDRLPAQISASIEYTPAQHATVSALWLCCMLVTSISADKAAKLIVMLVLCGLLGYDNLNRNITLSVIYATAAFGAVYVHNNVDNEDCVLYTLAAVGSIVLAVTPAVLATDAKTMHAAWVCVIAVAPLLQVTDNKTSARLSAILHDILLAPTAIAFADENLAVLYYVGGAYCAIASLYHSIAYSTYYSRAWIIASILISTALADKMALVALVVIDMELSVDMTHHASEPLRLRRGIRLISAAAAYAVIVPIQVMRALLLTMPSYPVAAVFMAAIVSTSALIQLKQSHGAALRPRGHHNYGDPESHAPARVTAPDTRYASALMLLLTYLW